MTMQRRSSFAVFLLLLGILAACQGPPAEPGPSGPSGAAAAAPTPTPTEAPHVGAMCEIGSAVVGFDAEGRIVCAPIGTQEPTPIPSPTPGPETTPEPDTTPPSISDFDFDPKSVSIAEGPAQITFTARITDERSGNAPGRPLSEAFSGENGPSSQAQFVSPSGLNGFFVLFHDRHRVSGDAFDGIYQHVQTISVDVEKGHWTLEQLVLADQAGNKQRLNEDEVRALGFPTTFEVR